MNQILDKLNNDLTIKFQEQKKVSGRELLDGNLVFRTNNNGLYIFEKGDMVYWFTPLGDSQLKTNPNNMTFVYQKSVNVGEIRGNYQKMNYN